MRVSEQERNAIKAACESGASFGYGNLISHLKAAWAATLMESGFTEKEAQSAAASSELPVKMHKDIVDNGEWDETGKRYR